VVSSSTTTPATKVAPASQDATRRSQRLGLIATVALVLLAVALPFIPPFTGQDWQRYLVGAALSAAAAVAFDFTAGYIDIVNFGFAAFMGLGGYVSAIFVTQYGISPWLGFPLGALAAGILGLLTGMLTLRLRGIYAAVMTWFVAIALMGMARNLTDITRGSLGLAVPPLLPTNDNAPYYYVILAILLLTLLVLTIIIRSRIGLAFRAIGQNLQASRASGINPTKFLVANFTISCAFAGVFGVFYAHYYGILTPAVMSTPHTIEILAIAYIGGRGSLWGPAIIAFPMSIAVSLMQVQFASLPGLYLVFYGLLLVLVMLFRPDGFAGVVRGIGRRIDGGQQANKPEAAPAPTANA
jgi:branched-chain amino acid transport system permease protein